MKKKYLYNGYEYSEDEIAKAASSAGLDFGAYISKHSIKEVQAKQETPKAASGEKYVYEGAEYSRDEIESAAKNVNVSVDEYLKQYGIEKKSQRRPKPLAALVQAHLPLHHLHQNHHHPNRLRYRRVKD